MNIASIQIGDNILSTEPHKKISNPVTLNSTNTSVGEYTIDLSTVLPNDGYIYELYLNSYTVGDNAGYSASVFYKTDKDPTYMCVAENWTKNSHHHNFFVMEVGNDRKLYQKITNNGGNAFLSYCNVTLYGYRKLYKDTRDLN
jgi:hypothetical protein